MKKQHLLLVLFLVFFAGISNGYAQCVSNELNPAAGIEYNYSATISGTGYNGTNTPTWDWYVTKALNIIDPLPIITVPTPLFTVNGATPYHNASTGVGNIKITWTAAAIADGGPFYLVLRYRENNSTSTPTCSAENIRVWEIKPINTFLLAIEGGMLNAGTYVATPNSFTCAADVVGATVTPGSPSTATLVYGNNNLYFVATASGIVGNWRPDIQIPALQTSQVYVSAQWTTDMSGAGGWVSFPVAANGTAQTLQSPSDATCSNAAGTPILIKVIIDNKNWQTLNEQPIQVALDGYLPTAYTKSDILGTGANPCQEAAPFFRNATFTIKARPTITGTPATLTLTNP
jgi:hypothetical protein